MAAITLLAVAHWSAYAISPNALGAIPRPVVFQTIYLLLAVAIMLVASKGEMAVFGFSRGSYRFSTRIFWWVLPVVLFSMLSAMASPGMHSFLKMGRMQTIVFVWCYSSFCEETLVRGVLQSFLMRCRSASEEKGNLARMPILISGFFFGAMHLSLVPMLGPGAAPIVFMATYLGLVAAYYRQKTGSILPSMLLHVLFNIAGSLPLWLVQGLHGRL